MKITEIKTTALNIPYQRSFHWSLGVVNAAEVILVEVKTDAGICGFGESISSPSADAIELLIKQAGKLCLGRNPLHNASLMREIYRKLFAAQGTGVPRFAAQVLAGLEMALWDIAGKAANCAVHELIGGPVRDRIQYFGFPQGDTPQSLAEEAKAWVNRGCDVIYIKVGRGEQSDLESVKQVRQAIGNKRLRIDANEAWDALTALRMIHKLAPFDIEFVEQPTPSASLSALCQVKASSPIAIAADQLVFTPEDVYEVCRRQAADVIVLGLHETGGITRFIQAAAIAGAAGINICLHGLYESGITTCASNQIGAAIANLDEGNQYMNHFLVEDIIESPDLKLVDGKLAVLSGPGLGFDLDWDAVGRAKERHLATLKG